MGKRGEEKEVGAKGNLIVYINVTRNNPCSVPTDGTYTPKQTMMAQSLKSAGAEINVKILITKDTHGTSTSLCKFQRTAYVLSGGR